MMRPADRIRLIISLLAVAAGIGCGFLAVRLGLPRSILHAGLSLAFALFALGFVAAGLFAILGRRSRPAQAEATTFFLGAMLAAFICFVGAMKHGEQVATVRGDLVSVRQDRGRKHDDIEFRLRGDPEPFRWNCHTRRCSDAGPLLALGKAVPVPIEARVVGRDVIGLSVGGRAYLDPDRELGRIRALANFMVIGGGLGALALVWFGLRRLRRG